MKFGWPISLFGHLALAFGGLLILSNPLDSEPQKLIVPVDLLTVDELTNIKAAIKAETPTDTPPMTLETPMENAPEEGETSDAVRETETLTTEIELVPDETAETINVPDETETDKPAFNLDQMSALINRTRDAQPEKNQQRSLQSEQNVYAFAELARAQSGEGTAMTISELEALQSAMYKCWRIPLDAKNPEELGVRVKVKLRRNGDVQMVELLDKPRINTSSNPYLKIAAQRAVSAVSKCAPYDFLPLEKYSMWQEMTLNFVPEV